MTSTKSIPLTDLHSGGSKKKFGKNLNKFVKQPSAPPIATGSSSRSSSSRTGLLLLSTKKSSSSLLGKPTAGVQRSATSQQDVLLNALHAEATEGEGKSKETPQAWGSKGTGTNAGAGTGTETQSKRHTPTNLPQLRDTKLGNPSWRSHGSAVSKQLPLEQISTNGLTPLISKGDETPAEKLATNEEAEIVTRPHDQNIKDLSAQTTQDETSADTHDTENGRSSQAYNESKSNESQVEFMARLARERAEKRRKEEESRLLEQKERAAARLQALEEKMGPKVSTETDVGPIVRTSSSSSGVILEPLPRNQPNANMAKGNSTRSRDQIQKTRTLYDPTRPYSSLVGGNAPNSPKTSTTVNESNHETPKKTEVMDTSNASGSPSVSKIQLSSYDDQHRGGRSTTSGPRMLFDPKSGSMVAVPKREENGTASSNKNRRERGKDKGRNGRDTTKRNESSTGYVTRLDGSRPLSRKERKREAKERKNSTDNSSSHSPSLRDKANSRGGKNASYRKVNSKQEKLPRTRGVLYKRDENGNLLSADGCDGDVGYGSHSVPGGRIRNAKAYTSYHKNAVDLSSSMHPYHQHHVTDPTSFHVEHENYMTNLQIGLTRDHFMRSPKKVTEGNVHILPEPVTVKPNEIIELLTGLEDSPTLQATAAVWAPSEAALALAASKKNALETILKDKSLDEEENGDISESEVHAMNAMALIDTDGEECQSPSVGLGLGFDPTKNMDFVMMSPAKGGTGVVNETTVSNLTLNTSRPLSNPFASSHILGSSTWGATGSMGSLSDWDYSRNGSKTGIEPMQNPGGNGVVGTTSFLSLGNLGDNQRTWGTGGIGGSFTGLGDLSGSNNIRGDTD
jgi:hypothetical protein